MAKYDPMSTFSENVRHEMERGKWTQKDIADACGWTQPDVSKLLGCKSNPTLSTMQAVADALGLPLHQLLTPSRKKEHAA